jgi:hypothetical protein
MLVGRPFVDVRIIIWDNRQCGERNEIIQTAHNFKTKQK